MGSSVRIRCDSTFCEVQETARSQKVKRRFSLLAGVSRNILITHTQCATAVRDTLPLLPRVFLPDLGRLGCLGPSAAHLIISPKLPNRSRSIPPNAPHHVTIQRSVRVHMQNGMNEFFRRDVHAKKSKQVTITI